jgi:hypothetical protein
MRGYSRSNHQVAFSHGLQFMRSFDLYPETFRPIFSKSDDITDDGVVTMKMMSSRNCHLQSDCRILSIFIKLDEAATCQRRDPRNIEVSLAHSQLTRTESFSLSLNVNRDNILTISISSGENMSCDKDNECSSHQERG